MSSKILLISGATGKQGGAVVAALKAVTTPEEFTLVALTRNDGSRAAEDLTNTYPDVRIINGTLDDSPGVFETIRQDLGFQHVWGVFSVQPVLSRGASVESEERRGKALVDASIAAGVEMFVYSSADRHGAASDSDPTVVPHFASKFRIEKHLEEKAQGTQMKWTILRPVAFMENFSPGLMGKVFPTAMKQGLGKSKKLQLVSVKDIGYFAAQAFLKPEEYDKQKISLAGDDLSFEELSALYRKVVGSSLPTTFGFVANGLLWASAEFGIMMKWFADVGFDVDIQALRVRHPGLLSMGDWLGKRENGFVR